MSEQVMTPAKPMVAKPMFNSTLQRTAITPAAHGILQRCSNGVECAECRTKREQREGTLQRAAVNAAPAPAVPSIVHDVLNSPGQPLDAGIRAFMEPRFNYDFSGVRVHTGETAGQSAKAIHAHAYTVGRDVVFGTGRYAPQTSEGKKLLAHELTHVVQQVSNGVIQRQKNDEEEQTSGAIDAAMQDVVQQDTVKAPNTPEDMANTLDEEESDVPPEGLDSFPEFSYISEDIAPGRDDRTDMAIATMPFHSTLTPTMAQIIPPDHISEREAEIVSSTILSDKAIHAMSAISRYAPTTAKLIQRQISWDDRNVLNWADFKGAVPKNAPFDALTSSKMRMANMPPPKQDAQADLQNPCQNGRKQTTEFHATVAFDPATIQVKALMFPSESWSEPTKQSAGLLAHEQGHFDITHVIAVKTQSALRAWVKANTAQATKCGRNPALSAALHSWRALKANETIRNTWATGGRLLDQAQKDYDNDTQHGLGAAQQKTWLGDIAAGLKKYNL